MLGLKISKDNKIVGLYEFSSSKDREEYLRELGYVNGSGIWYHPFSKETAGFFEKGCTQLYYSCDKRIKFNKNTIMDYFLLKL